MSKIKNFTLLLVPGVLLFISCASPSPPAKAPETPVVPKEASSEGKALFDKKCASCHGSKGEGTAMAPKIAGHSMTAMMMQMRNPTGGMMPAFTTAQLSDAEANKIAEYVNSLAPSTAIGGEWERTAPENVHHWMTLLAIKTNDVADAKHHMEQALTFVKEPKHKAGMEKALQLIAEGKPHDAEHEIEEMAGSESPSGITMQRFHLQLTGKAIEAKSVADVKHHMEKFMAKADDKKKSIARELLEKVEKGDFHEAEHELEELIKG